jgi:hypothetical protein
MDYDILKMDYNILITRPLISNLSLYDKDGRPFFLIYLVYHDVIKREIL